MVVGVEVDVVDDAVAVDEEEVTEDVSASGTALVVDVVELGVDEGDVEISSKSRATPSCEIFCAAF